MSNPYAPPEHGPRAAAPQGDGDQGDQGEQGRAAPQPGPDGAAVPSSGTSGGAAVPWSGTPGVDPTPLPGIAPGDGPATPAPYHSPAGVPYERTSRVPPPPPHPADVHRLAVLTRATSLLVLTAVLADLLSFPWYLAGAPVALAALVVGGRALVVTARTHRAGPGRGVLALLLVVAVLSLARPATAALTWDAEQALARCTSGALTVQAQNGCLSDYRQALDARAAQLTRRSP